MVVGGWEGDGGEREKSTPGMTADGALAPMLWQCFRSPPPPASRHRVHRHIFYATDAVCTDVSPATLQSLHLHEIPATSSASI